MCFLLDLGRPSPPMGHQRSWFLGLQVWTGTVPLSLKLVDGRFWDFFLITGSLEGSSLVPSGEVPGLSLSWPRFNPWSGN